MEFRIDTRYLKDEIPKLKAGDRVLLSGTILNARDAAHKRLCEAYSSGEELPLSLKDEIIYYMGPSPKKPNEIIGASGPTTAGRMDKYTPLMLDLGVIGMIGKGYRDKSVIDSIIKHQAIYFIAIGGAGALISSCITKCELVAYGDLGPEAITRLEIVGLPLIVGVDCLGNDFYNIGQKDYLRSLV